MNFVEWKDIPGVTYMGRGGEGKQKGLTIESEISFYGDKPDVIFIHPINSRGDEGNCRIEIPFEKAYDFLSALRNEIDRAKRIRRKKEPKP